MGPVAEALSMLATTQGLTLLLVGTLVGIVVAIIPGLGSPIALAVLIPVTFTLSPVEALMLLVPVIGAGGFAGSMTAILVGVPGDETNAATVIDGSEMARQGRAGEAIGASATASALGALIGVGVLIAAIPLMREIILRVGPPELFVFALLGILMVGAVSGRNQLKGIVSGLLGMSLALIGYNYALGGVRFTFGFGELNQGIPVVPALIGLFAIPEVVMMLRSRHPVSPHVVARGGVARGIKAVLTRPRLLFQSALMGTGIGAIPGIGGSVICWISYAAARKTSKHPEQFGHGSVEGIIGPEASIDAKDGGQLMPLLALGIPGGVSTAILAGAFMLHGIQPGISMFTSNLSIVYVMVFALIFSNVLTSVLGLATANAMVKVTRVPPYALGPIVVSLAALGAFVAEGSFYGPLMFLIFGGLGYLLVRGGYSRAAIVVGLILLPIVETNLHISLQSHRGEMTFLLRPATLGILFVSLAIIALPLVWRRVRSRWERDPAQAPEDTAVPSTTRSRELHHAMPFGRAAASSQEGSDASAQSVLQRGSLKAEVALESSRSSEQRDKHSPIADIAVCLLTLAIGVLLAIEGWSLPTDQKLVPTVLLPLLLATTCVVTVRAVRSSTSPWRITQIDRQDVIALAAVAVLPLFMYFFGVMVGIVVWTSIAIVTYALRASRKWPEMIILVIIVIIIGGALEGLVTQFLEIRLPGTGIVF